MLKYYKKIRIRDKQNRIRKKINSEIIKKYRLRSCLPEPDAVRFPADFPNG